MKTIGLNVKEEMEDINNTFSSLYVNEDGILMLGEPNRFTSIVEGFKFSVYNIDNGRKFDYEIFFLDGDGNLCNGYSEILCKNEKLRYK